MKYLPSLAMVGYFFVLHVGENDACTVNDTRTYREGIPGAPLFFYASVAIAR